MLYRVLAPLAGVVVAIALSFNAQAAVPFDPELPELPAEVRLPRWDEARAAMTVDAQLLDRCLADEQACPSPRLKAWRTLVLQLAGKNAQAQLTAVNRFVNQVPYVRDSDQYGRRDVWAGAWHFLQNQGDCEDYAIAKYLTLQRLGYATRDLRILIVEDRALGLAHAVLAVRVDGAIWLLDNQAETPSRAERQVRYDPYYAVNEESRWLHRLPGAASTGSGS